MLIQDIYTQYKIPPHLQLHMLRVAWVCKMICENWTGEKLHTDAVVQAALLHDLGNRVKMWILPGIHEPTGKELDEFLATRDEMREKYGRNDHLANVMICKELDVQQRVINLVDGIWFEKFTSYTLHDAEDLIINYSDLRVGPKGVLTTYERLREAAMRYDNQKRLIALESTIQATDAQEANIFQHCSITPDDMTDESIDPLLDELRWYEIQT